MNILLCGLPFSGKSTYGSLAAARLKVAYFDTDKLLEQHYEQREGIDKSCRQIHQELGDAGFRELEEEVISKLPFACPPKKHHIISLGGGALLSESNRVVLQAMGRIVFLKTPIEVLLERMNRGVSLPSYLSSNDPETSFRLLAEDRRQHYEEYSDIIINTEHLVDDEIVDAICLCLGRPVQ